MSATQREKATDARRKKSKDRGLVCLAMLVNVDMITNRKKRRSSSSSRRRRK
jgi:hypothetical protein